MPTVGRRRSQPEGAGRAPDPRVVAAIAAVLAVLEEVPVQIRVRPLWPDPGPWRLVGRRDSMRGGWPW
ncbi:MAG: hypothetical protein ACP5QO_14825 [Clostridia bacterium]